MAVPAFHPPTAISVLRFLDLDFRALNLLYLEIKNLEIIQRMTIHCGYCHTKNLSQSFYPLSYFAL